MTDHDLRPSFLIKASYVLHPDDVEVYPGLAARMAVAARQRVGCVFLDAAQDVLDPNMFHLIEGWSSQEAFEEHLASDKFQEILKAALAMRIVDRAGTRYTVSAAEALAMPT